MNELKAGVLVTPHNEGMCFHRSSAVIAVTEGETEFYLKSEADKVIAEKDEKIEELEEHIGELQKATDSAWRKVNVYYDELRHSNYKRCLAMAEWCKARYDEEDAKLNRWASSWDYVSKEMKYWERWQWRWEELAEEPTWAKFLQLIHKEAK